MGAQAFQIYEAPTRDLTEMRRDMWVWAEPVIGDRAAESYGLALPNMSAANFMARKHCRLWQAVIYDQPEAIPALRKDVHRTCEQFGLAAEVSNEVDAILYDELVDIVLSRFRVSRRTTEALGVVLKSAPICVAAERAAA